jgi:hypothetical protein
MPALARENRLSNGAERAGGTEVGQAGGLAIAMIAQKDVFGFDV